MEDCLSPNPAYFVGNWVHCGAICHIILIKVSHIRARLKGKLGTEDLAIRVLLHVSTGAYT